jgi:RAD54-like protein 2
VFLSQTKAKYVLCIVPINTLQNWIAEFNMWLPEEGNLDKYLKKDKDTNQLKYRNFKVFALNEAKSMTARAKEIFSWRKFGGVLLLGYEMYRILTSNNKKKSTKDDDIDPKVFDEINKELQSSLIDPGPDLVVCDEGHRIKNCNAATSLALKNIRTKRRIVLTGYPLQNNLIEYWCMVDFVRPNYLGLKAEFTNMFERPIVNGQCIDATPSDRRLMRYRAHVLYQLLKGFVQRYPNFNY